MSKEKIKLVLIDPKDTKIWDSVAKTARRVATWPAWKRGLGLVVDDHVDIEKACLDLGGEG